MLGAQIVFAAGGTGTLNTTGNNAALAWRLENGGQRLITNVEGMVDTSMVLELSATILHLRFTDAQLSGAEVTLRPLGTLDVLAAFDSVWMRYDRLYPYFTYKQVDWRAQRDKYRPRAAAAANMDALASVLTDLFLPLRDVHVWITRPDGSVIRPYAPQLPMNWDRTTWSTYIARAGYRATYSQGYGRFGDVGYVVVGSWDPSQVDVSALDGALDQLRDTRALIIDVRMNGGGSDLPATQVAGRFTIEPFIGAYRQMRNGPGYDDLSPLTPTSVAPRGSWTYTKPVYVLVGRGVFSANEVFASMMHALPQVKLVGDTTGGGMGNAVSVLLTNGWTYTAPSAVTYTAKREMIEWRGIEPDIYVRATAVDFSQGVDPVLEYALAHIGTP